MAEWSNAPVLDDAQLRPAQAHLPWQVMPKLKPAGKLSSCGRVAEWSNAPVLKTGRGASLSWVRIPCGRDDYRRGKKEGGAIVWGLVCGTHGSSVTTGSRDGRTRGNGGCRIAPGRPFTPSHNATRRANLAVRCGTDWFAARPPRRTRHHVRRPERKRGMRPPKAGKHSPTCIPPGGC